MISGFWGAIFKKAINPFLSNHATRFGYGVNFKRAVVHRLPVERR